MPIRFPPDHQLCSELGIGPGAPQQPPYNHEIDGNLERVDFRESVVFRVPEFSSPNGVWASWMTVPWPGTVGSSPTMPASGLAAPTAHYVSGRSAALRKRGERVRQDRSFIREATGILFHSASAVPDKTCANACCTNTFASCCTLRVSSCAYWKAARSDARTTARGHLDRTGGNIVRPMKRLAVPPDASLFPSGMPRTYQHQERGR